ncbi:MATE family efflux transporter [Pleionea sp. CnH1-48]|uniref:MATE family efflux transporter n=1 Tax=Pleionea sp. CnH1-48 TaxID=2954494 RepID=UPI002098301A|nr:MATE family efflux transporter [Pleionea sp. CnH1-48]
MPKKDRYKQILSLALPILGGMMSQNILNLVDAAMVGYLGTAQLAAVGIASFINFVAAALFMGMSAGVQAMVARRIGEGRQKDAANPLNGALVAILVTAIPLSIVLTLYAENIMAWLNDDPEVIRYGSEYLEVRLMAIFAVGMNFCYRGYWSAIKLTGFYMRTLLIMHSLNIVLNYLLIYGKFGFPELGVAGAGLGTALSMFGGTLVYTYLALRHTRDFGFGLHLPHKETLITVVRISIPSSIQQLFFAMGFTILFWIVGQVGTAELAAANVLTNITLVAILPCIAFGISAATLVGQALGRGEPDDAHQWGWDTTVIAMITVFIIGLPMIIVPEFLLGLFLHEATAINIAILPLRLVGIGIMLDAIGLVLMNALQGAGATKDTMKVSLIMQWLLFLPLAYTMGPMLGFGLTAIWTVQFVYRSIQAGIFAWLWNQKKWTDIKLA